MNAVYVFSATSVALSLFLVACGEPANPGVVGGVDTGDPSDTGGGDDGGSDDTEEPVPACAGDHFVSSGEPWSMPDYTEDFPELSGTEYCDNGWQQTWTTTDLTGDGLPDLVVTVDCQYPATGASSWRVHTNTGDGFAATPVTWALPDYAEDLDAASGTGWCDNGWHQTWSLVDMNGDARPDLVMTVDCQFEATGVTQWRVHTNTGSGFAAQPTPWALPDYPEDFEQVGETEYCASGGVQTWTLLDLTADGKPDLVLTEECARQATGRTDWRVHANTGSGFAAAATSYALPDYPEDLVLTGQTEYCATGGKQTWATSDLTGDGRPDLVFSEECARAATGVSSWRVHAGGASGFAAEASGWALPGYPEPFHTLGETEYCASGRQTWTTSDLTGDGKPDLVLTEECGRAATGTTEWRVHPNTGSGFGAAESWGLPDLAEDLYTIAETEYCSQGTQIWSTLDLDGDGLPDLTLTDTCGTSWSGWRAHRGACAND